MTFSAPWTLHKLLILRLSSDRFRLQTPRILLNLTVPSGGQRADILVHRPGVPRRRYVRLRGVGALRCGGTGAVQRRGPGTRCQQSDLHHAAGGAGSREDVSGIDKGRDPVVPGLSRGREGGVIRRDEGGAQRFDVPVAAAGSAFRILPSKRGKYIAVCGCLVLRDSN